MIEKVAESRPDFVASIAVEFACFEPQHFAKMLADRPVAGYLNLKVEMGD